MVFPEVWNIYGFSKYFLFVFLTFIYLFNLFIFLFGCTGSQLQQAGSLVAAYWLLSCGTWAHQLQLKGSLVDACGLLQLWLVGSLVVAHWLLSCSTQAPQLWHSNSWLRHTCGIQFPDQGSNPGPLHWEQGVLTTAPQKKSP